MRFTDKFVLIPIERYKSLVRDTTDNPKANCEENKNKDNIYIGEGEKLDSIEGEVKGEGAPINLEERIVTDTSTNLNNTENKVKKQNTIRQNTIKRKKIENTEGKKRRFKDSVIIENKKPKKPSETNNRVSIKTQNNREKKIPLPPPGIPNNSRVSFSPSYILNKWVKLF
jgi:hypothetical protein